MKLILLTVAGIALAGGGARRADACSCAPPPPPCERYWNHDAVFSGKVTSVKSGPGYTLVATIAVDEKFRGATFTRTVDVTGGGMCGVEFKTGESYFVYAHNASGQLHAGLCGGTRHLADAADDIAYARNIPSRTLAVVEGKVLLEQDDGTTVERAGATVVAQGTKLSAKSGADGTYKLAVPPGKYTLDVVDPGTIVRWKRFETVTLPNAAACARANVTVVYNGRISGQLRDHTGKPAPNISISAHATDARHHWRLDATSDASGNYLIEGVPAGSYVVAVGHIDDGGPDDRQPIPTTFYPGVPTEAKAQKVAVTRAALTAKIDFQLPAPLPVYKVSGTLRRKGAPLANTHINFHTKLGPQYGRQSGGPTDASGHFEFRDVAGSEISLEVCRPDAGPDNYKTACRVIERKLTADLTIDVDYPEP